MLHPSYSDLMEVVNKNVEPGEAPVVNSRYSIVMATSRRARQIVAGSDPLVEDIEGKKPLSVAVDELNQGKYTILAEDSEEEDQAGDASATIDDASAKADDTDSTETAGATEE